MAEVFSYLANDENVIDESNVDAATGHPGIWTSIGGTAGAGKHDTNAMFNTMAAIRVSRAATSESFQARKVLAAPVGRLQAGCFVRIPALPTQTVSGWIFHTFRSSAGFMGNLAFNLPSQTAGRLGLRNQAGVTVPGSIATSNFPINTIVWVESAVKKGTSSTTGTLEYAYFLAPYSVSSPAFTVSFTNVDTLTTDPNEARFEVNGNTLVPNPIELWGFRLGDAATGWMGPALIAPVTTLSGRAAYIITSSTQGAVISYSINKTAGPTPPLPPEDLGSGRFLVYPDSDSSITYTVTTSSDSGSDSDDYIVPPASSSNIKQMFLDSSGVLR